MEIVNRSDLNKEELRLLKKAKSVAGRSISDLGHQVGCIIRCENGEEFLGAANIRSRTIGSTCAERMTFDQMYFHKNQHPQICVIIGKLPKADWRREWSDRKICTPCGVCLEMFRQAIQSLKLKNLDFLCSSWNGKKILRAKLSDLFPIIN